MPRIKEYKYPMTTSGRYLDSFCDSIDSTLNYDILDHIREADLSKVPSSTQREGFELMRELLEWAMLARRHPALRPLGRPFRLP